GWRKETKGYSIIYGAAVHLIDLVCWILGQYPVELRCVGNNLATSGSGFSKNDFASMFLTFKDGLIAQISAHGGCAHPHFHQLESWGTKMTFLHRWEKSCWIEGDDASFAVRNVEGEYPAKTLRRQATVSFVD